MGLISNTCVCSATLKKRSRITLTLLLVNLGFRNLHLLGGIEMKHTCLLSSPKQNMVKLELLWASLVSDDFLGSDMCRLSVLYMETAFPRVPNIMCRFPQIMCPNVIKLFVDVFPDQLSTYHQIFVVTFQDYVFLQEDRIPLALFDSRMYVG